MIGPADELVISVWKNPELSGRLAVRPDGIVTIALIGEVYAEGMTPTELRQEIQRRLGAYLKAEDAIVTVAVTAVNSYYVTVTGSVAKPGRFASPDYLTVSDAIALAGGPTRFASPDDTLILRRGRTGAVKRIPIYYPGIVSGERIEQNLVLHRGDIVYVP